MVLTTEKFLNITLENVINIELVSRLPQLGLDQCMLTSWMPISNDMESPVKITINLGNKRL